MASINGIDITNNFVWLNEFEFSKIEQSERYTEDGRLVIFQNKKQKPREIKYGNSWLTYGTVKELALIRDSGSVVVFIHKDGRQFYVILKELNTEPLQPLNEYNDTDKFAVELLMREV